MKKQPTILVSHIIPPPVRYFSGEPPPDGGEGGAGGAGGDANTAVLDFRAPDIDIAADFMRDEPAPDITKAGDAGKPPAKEPAPGKKPDPAPAAPKPGDKPVPNGDPPVKQLREELAALKLERDELKAYREKGDPKLAEAEKALKEKETEIAAAKTSITEYERKLAMADPAVTAKLREADGIYDKDAAKFYTAVPELPQPLVNQLVVEFDQLPFGKPEYKQARADFEAKVNEALGGSDTQEHRKLDKALNFIERTHEYAAERPKLEAEMRSSAFKLQRDAQLAGYTKQSQFVRDALEKAKSIPEGIEKTDPYHPKLMIKTFMDVLPEDQQAVFAKDIPEFVERVLAGPKPRGEQDYAGMTPVQVKESQAAEAAKYESDRAIAADVMFNGLRALRLFPILVKEWKRLREKVKEDVDANPPDPTKGGADGSQAAADDILKFKAPNLNDVNI